LETINLPAIEHIFEKLIEKQSLQQSVELKSEELTDLVSLAITGQNLLDEIVSKRRGATHNVKFNQAISKALACLQALQIASESVKIPVDATLRELSEDIPLEPEERVACELHVKKHHGLEVGQSITGPKLPTPHTVTDIELLPETGGNHQFRVTAKKRLINGDLSKNPVSIYVPVSGPRQGVWA